MESGVSGITSTIDRTFKTVDIQLYTGRCGVRGLGSQLLRVGHDIRSEP